MSKILKLDEFPKEDEIGIGKVTVEYFQEDDCCGDKDEYQTLTLTTESNGINSFIRMKTGSDDPNNKVNYWSFDDVDNLIEIIKDFKQKATL